MKDLPRIGFSSCFFHKDPNRAIFKGKTLLYMEESLVHWITGEKALAFLIPTVNPASPIKLKHLVAELDAVVFQGGADVSPSSYGEIPLRPEWAGDAVRDAYEIELVRECLAQKKPMLGICRGAQLLNVAFGGTLYQDIQTQVKEARVHRDWEQYEQNTHVVHFEKGSSLEKLFNRREARVNSVHHQAIKDLGKGLVIEARAEDDGVIEAVCSVSEPFTFAFQWHPEFHDPKDTTLLDCRPILREFFKAASR